MKSEITSFIDQQSWLDGVDPLQKAVRETLAAAGPLKDALHGVWLGHPLHPVLTDIPVGAWTAAAFLDAAAAISGSSGMEAAADTAVAIGLAGAAGAAITGITDWSETDYGAKRIGTVHATLNIVATALYAGSLALRRTRRRGAGVALSLLGYAIAGTSAYLGGHLVFGEQVGVDHDATPDRGQPEDFVAVASEAELKEDTPHRADAGDTAICIVRHRGKNCAIGNTCPHLGGPLSEGSVEGDAIRCPWHGSEFRLDDGRVVRGPSTYSVRHFDVRVNDGQIEVRAAERG